MPESREHAKDIPETEERRRSFVLNTARDDENNICFSFNVRQYNIAYSVVHVQLRFKIFFVKGVRFTQKLGNKISGVFHDQFQFSMTTKR